MPFVQLSVGKVHYLEQGTGTPLLLLHANPGDSQDYAAVIPTLAKQYRVIALDWLGYGLSDRPLHPEQLNMDDFYLMFREFLTALSLPPALMIGNSFSGNIILRLASEVPEQVRGLVMISSAVFSPQNLFTQFFCRFQGSRFSVAPYYFAKLYLHERNDITHGMLNRAATTQSREAPKQLNRALWRNFALPNDLLLAACANIKTSTLICFGDKDPIVPAKKNSKVALRYLPHAELVTFPCGHAPFAELPTEFLKHVLPFLDQH
jgi:pimeloyl-ACP methyl ester carboxylesterase